MWNQCKEINVACRQLKTKFDKDFMQQVVVQM